MKKFSKKIKQILSFYAYGFPKILIWIGLVGLMFKTIFVYFESTDFSSVANFYLFILASILALSSVVFSYAGVLNINERKNEIIEIGENLLYVSVSMLSALVLAWLGFELKKIFDLKIHSPLWNNAVSIFVLSWSYLYLSYVANGLYSTYVDLEKILWFKVRNRID